MTPAEVPAVAVYAGDTCAFPSYTFQSSASPPTPVDLVAEGWVGWTASWRPAPSSVDAIPLSVDLSLAAVGTIGVSASAAQTRAMGTSGVWDLQAERPGEVRTFLRGATTYLMDVTRD
jgi:hypothetical protein